MIVGIEQTTDSRSPETVVTRLSSRRAALAWVAQGGNLAWPAAANKDLPGGQQNWHHRLRQAYEELEDAHGEDGGPGPWVTTMGGSP